MDIDDILASVDQPDASTPQSTALDHQLLTRFWIAERGVSELLPWPAGLMDRTMERVRRQIESIEDLAASSSDPYSTATNSNSNNNPTLNLKLSILQTDLSRTQYLVRSLLRHRLSKLSKHSMHYLLLVSPGPSSSPQNNNDNDDDENDPHPQDSIPPLPPTSSNPDTAAPLSPQELAFLHAHQSLLAKHYASSFLSSFPPQLRRLDDNAGGTSMVQAPETKEVVFVRCLVDGVRVVVPAADAGEDDIYATAMRVGDVAVVRWEGVRDAWGGGRWRFYNTF
ncbi:hypothetical protein P168DRAFT_282890 [Aspergillus campestris IBT 28561]|uniref:DNA replication complex GINS protein SLD5 n=1 Tax=Aspergillus campestris (strain IBT 28561) TaxID=1392248 RepID=A0A2I1CZS1_ASPC2|nr:uncharacterized protein P168DRAFT_282890 [Aspergillus campestris IBT 28561]PKY03124.1 hypothetical protein P168DRAFT_282890 [Aspergillus campestris IBT 28561]